MTQNKIDIKALDALIQSAAKKVGAKKENDVCRYIPSPTGIGYIHHFTMRKMRTEQPEQLQDLLNKHIINVDKPVSVSPKPRAARGSRKRRDQLLFSKTDIERLLGMARQTGDSEMIRKLTPKKDLRTIKRELISSIRHGRIDQELWLSYTETLNHHNALAAAGSVPSFA